MAESAPQDASIRMDGNTLVCSHCWTVNGIGPLSAALDELPVPDGDSVVIDGAAIAAMDTSGAWLLLQVRRHMEAANRQVSLITMRSTLGLHAQALAQEEDALKAA